MSLTNMYLVWKEDGVSCLYSATHFGHKSLVEVLLSKGAKVNLANSDGVAPIHLAAADGYPRLISTLIKGTHAMSPSHIPNGVFDIVDYWQGFIEFKKWWSS